MWHHFELTHSQPLAVQRRVTLSAEEWNYLQLSVIGAASAISLIVSTISQRWTNGDGLVGTYLPPHSVCGLVVRIGSYVFEISRNCWFQAWAEERWYLAGRSPPAGRLTRLLCSDKRTRTESVSGNWDLVWFSMVTTWGESSRNESKLPCWAVTVRNAYPKIAYQ